MKRETRITDRQTTNETVTPWLSHERTKRSGVKGESSNLGRQLESASDLNCSVISFLSDLIFEV